jgi:hypothetical protein
MSIDVHCSNSLAYLLPDRPDMLSRPALVDLVVAAVGVVAAMVLMRQALQPVGVMLRAFTAAALAILVAAAALAFLAAAVLTGR